MLIAIVTATCPIVSIVPTDPRKHVDLSFIVTSVAIDVTQLASVAVVAIAR